MSMSMHMHMHMHAHMHDQVKYLGGPDRVYKVHKKDVTVPPEVHRGA